MESIKSQRGLQQARIALRLDDTPLNRRAAAKQPQTLEHVRYPVQSR